MSIIDTIKQDQINARKSRESIKASLLTTLYSEAALVGKNKGNRESTDEDVFYYIRNNLIDIQEQDQVKDIIITSIVDNAVYSEHDYDLKEKDE